MKTNKKIIEDFFKAYEKSFQKAIEGTPFDPKILAANFTGSFLQASPKGVMTGKNDKKFLETLPKIYEHYRLIGTQSMKIGEQVVIPIDELHSMVKIHWLSAYLRKDGKKITIDFDVHYLLQHIGGQVKIFAFIAGDEEKVMKEHGLIA